MQALDFLFDIWLAVAEPDQFLLDVSLQLIKRSQGFDLTINLFFQLAFVSKAASKFFDPVFFRIHKAPILLVRDRSPTARLPD